MRRVTRYGLIVTALSGALAAGASGVRPRGHGLDALPHRIAVENREPMPPPPDPSLLRVCADPNNLPFSNDRGEGFENRIAAIVARGLRKRATFYWQPQRRGFIRTTLNAGWCDIVMGVPAQSEMTATTAPYYRSTYVFVSRRGGRQPIRSLDDPRLRRVRIGVELTGDDYDNPPAVQALASRHIIDNVRGYLVYGDYSAPDPPRRVIDAVAAGEVDTAIAWGPRAGYFAPRSVVPLQIVAVAPERDGSGASFAFDIAMGVRRRDRALREAVDRIINARASEIRAVLARYGVPLLPAGEDEKR